MFNLGSKNEVVSVPEPKSEVEKSQAERAAKTVNSGVLVQVGAHCDGLASKLGKRQTSNALSDSQPAKKKRCGHGQEAELRQ
jgi:hypothetical protein